MAHRPPCVTSESRVRKPVCLGTWPSHPVSCGSSESQSPSGACGNGGSRTPKAHTGVRAPCGALSTSRAQPPCQSHAGSSVAQSTPGDRINGLLSHRRSSRLHGETRGTTATGTNDRLQDGCAHARCSPQNPSHPSSPTGLVPV